MEKDPEEQLPKYQIRNIEIRYVWTYMYRTLFKEQPPDWYQISEICITVHTDF